jgi:hypothetical protein
VRGGEYRTDEYGTGNEEARNSLLSESYFLVHLFDILLVNEPYRKKKKEEYTILTLGCSLLPLSPLTRYPAVSAAGVFPMAGYPNGSIAAGSCPIAGHTYILSPLPTPFGAYPYRITVSSRTIRAASYSCRKIQSYPYMLCLYCRY